MVTCAMRYEPSIRQLETLYGQDQDGFVGVLTILKAVKSNAFVEPWDLQHHLHQLVRTSLFLYMGRGFPAHKLS